MQMPREFYLRNIEMNSQKPSSSWLGRCSETATAGSKKRKKKSVWGENMVGFCLDTIEYLLSLPALARSLSVALSRSRSPLTHTVARCQREAGAVQPPSGGSGERRVSSELVVTKTFAPTDTL